MVVVKLRHCISYLAPPYTRGQVPGHGVTGSSLQPWLYDVKGAA